MKRRTEAYTEHHISGECSRKIVNEVISQNVPDAVTAIIVIVGQP